MIEPPVAGLAALVVGFQPELDVLEKLLATLLQEASLVILADNGGCEELFVRHPELRKRVQHLPMGGNQGLGEALNRGFDFAATRDCQYVATFDQDSEPPIGMLSRLVQTHLELDRQGVRCAAVGPTYFDRREGAAKKFPLYREVNGKIARLGQTVPLDPGSLQAVDVLITSGMMVSMAAWSAGLKYDSKLFVDYTDTDWCFRARAAGYRLFVDLRCEMGHAMSDAPPVRVGRLNLLRYSPVRRYFYFRNTVYFVRQPFVSRAWKRRLLAGLCIRLVSNFVIDAKRWQGTRMAILGLWDGVNGRFGRLPN